MAEPGPIRSPAGTTGQDANAVYALGAKIVAPALAEMITELWLATPFKGGPHQQRLDQIATLEHGEPLS